MMEAMTGSDVMIGGYVINSGHWDERGWWVNEIWGQCDDELLLGKTYWCKD